MFEALQFQLDQIREVQELSLIRGEKIETLMEKADELTATSYEYVKTAKKTKQTMCFRKYRYILAGVFCTLLLVFIIVLIFVH